MPWISLSANAFAAVQGYTHTQAVVGSSILVVLGVVVVVLLVRMWLSRH
jgi:hypothetical protein